VVREEYAKKNNFSSPLQLTLDVRTYMHFYLYFISMDR